MLRCKIRIFVSNKTQNSMTVDDFLKENKQILKIMSMNGLSVDLGRCAGMVEVFEKAKAEHGYKYAVELCKDRYCLKSKTVVYRILEVLKRVLP